MSGPRPKPNPHSAQDSAGDVVRWAAFSCVLVPVVLLWYGTSLAGTAGTALGLAAVTAVCRYLLRRSERDTPSPHRAPHGTSHGTHRGAPHRAPHRAPRGAVRGAARGAARGGGRHTRGTPPVD
ncbi:hypothetical protein ABT075_20325 [Streptomyces sp. NPDC002677]|uniref:hypothetical protein n=1 Tax=Streptomyces sp. NPDC002677 TaxID=3154774 RepID=UPI003332E5D7